MRSQHYTLFAVLFLLLYNCNISATIFNYDINASDSIYSGNLLEDSLNEASLPRRSMARSSDSPIDNPNVPHHSIIDIENKEVGEIEIISGTSPTGAKTYDVPIKVAPAMHDFAPHISLSYNSQRGNSSIGVGWAVSGLTEITRVGKTIYYDGTTEGIRMNNTDAFAINGTRLIKKSEYEDHILYQSETGNIMVKGYTSGDVMCYFELFYPDGTHGICGYTSNIYNSISYPQMSITDLWGNEIQYFYVSHGNHYSIFKIMYTGGTIDFIYDSYRPDNILTYSAGTEILEDRLLKQIICKRGNDILGTYDLTYDESLGSSHLSQIGYSANGVSLNPLCFYYNTVNIGNSYATHHTQLTRYHNLPNLNNISALVGHFDYQGNRDGLIVYPAIPAYFDKKVSGKHIYQNKYNGTENIYLYTSLDSSEAHVDSIATGTGFAGILCADLDGTGKESIVRVRNPQSSGRDYLYFDVYSMADNGNYSYQYTRSYDAGPLYSGPKGNKSVSPKTFHVGDFDGDGKIEILVMGGHPEGCSSYYPTSCHMYNLTTNQILYNTPLLDEYELHFFGEWDTDAQSIENSTDRLLVIDYDGDGKSDLCHIGNSLTKVYTFNNTATGMTSSLVYTNYGLLKSRLADSDMLVGDFNGDGLTDVFVSAPANSAEGTHSQVFNSTGTGWFKSHDAGYIKKLDNSEYGMLAQDVNGDGVTDITHYSNIGFSTDIFLRNNPSGYNIGGSYYNDQPSKLIPIYINSRNSRPHFLTIRGGVVSTYHCTHNYTLASMMVGMKNSLGIIEQHEYKTLTEEWDSLPPNAESQTSNPEFPYIKLKEPLVVLSRSELYKDDSRIDYTIYNYGNAFYHRQGLGFRGFDALVKSNYRGKTSIQTFDPIRMGVPMEAFSPNGHSAYQYTVNVASDKTMKVLLASKTETDSLTGVVTQTSYTYNAYGYPTQEATTFLSDPNISTVKSYVYSSNPNVGVGYHLDYQTSQVTTISKGTDNTYVEGIYFTASEKRQPIVSQIRRNGNLVRSTTYSYDDHGDAISESVCSFTSSNPIVNSYQYNVYGQKNQGTDPMGHTSLYHYDSLGRLNEVYDERGNHTYYTYDAFGREVSVTMPDSTVKTTTREWVTDVEGALFVVTTEETGRPKTQTYYDALGREVRLRTQRFNDTYNRIDKQYDEYGRLSKVSLPYKGYTPLWTIYTYDNFDRTTSVTEASGRVTTYSYDGMSTATTEDGISTTRTYDVLGNLVAVEDPAGSITYEIAADGQPISITAPGEITTSFTYDQYRRRTSISDPSAGTTTYTYDAAGNLASETNANGQTTTFSHDQFGRLTTATYPEMTVNQSYNTYGDLTSVSSTNGVSRLMTYDSYGRLSTWKETVDSVWLQKGYSYASNNVSAISYTSHKGLLATENYSYTNGYLTNIAKDGALSLFQLTSENMLGLPTGATTLNLTRTYSYTPFGLPTGRTASGPSSTIYDESYSFDATTSNLLSRTDNRRNLTDHFVYDSLDRLKKHNYATVLYDEKGNVRHKSDVGSLIYNNAQKPYAVSRFFPRDSVLFRSTQDIAYYSFRRPREIAEGQYTLDFTYNSGLDRVKQEVAQNDTILETRYSLGSCYDYIVGTSVNQTEEDLYLAGGYYDAPMLMQRYVDGSSYLTHLVRDYQGSIVSIVDSTGFWHNDYSYDAWGRPRNPQTHVVYNPSALNTYSSAYRGYCGHEHLPQFGLINMNARLYDPALGRFLSPDPYVQLPDNTQSFNRYSYCLNNPLKYVDENGEYWHILIGAVLGGVANIIANWDNIDGFWQGVVIFGAGAGAGAATAATGGASGWTIVGVSAASGAGTAATNSIVAQTGKNFRGIDSVDWGTVGKSSFVGGISNAVGSAAGYYVSSAPWLVNGINSPAARSAIASPIAAGAGHITGGTAYGVLDGQDLRTAFTNALDGIGTNMAIGGAMGVASTVGTCYANKINPWNGRPINNDYITAKDWNLEYEVSRIKNGITYNNDEFHFHHDGSRFYNNPNKNGNLPQGVIYREFVVPTPGISRPGPQRIVVGSDGNWYYTPDHYKTFFKFIP